MTVLRAGGASDTGRVRTVNQDSMLLVDGAALFAVADGMGGHAAGEVASQVAVEALEANARPGVDGLVEAIRRANQAVLDRAAGEPELRGMGTTLCAVALVSGADGGIDQVVVANVGDSRVYLLRDGDLLQISEDHSLVEDLVREGRLSPEEARVHPQRNIVTRVLGNEPDVDVDTWTVDATEGDRFLLCSDGLFNEVDDDVTAAVLRRLADPEEAARELVRLANEGGGRDNITVVVVDVVDDGGRAEAASAALAAEGATATAPAVTPAAPASAPGRATDGVPPPPSGPPTSATLAPGSRITWRSVLFTLVVLALVVGAVGAVAWFARSTYFVGVDDGEVVIFRGRPGGLLWIDPTLEERTGLDLDDVPPARRPDVREGKEEPSLAAARRYVENLEDQARSATTTTTSSTTTSTSTTAPGAPTTVAGGTATS